VTDTKSRKIYYSWESFDSDVKVLANRLKPHKNISSIFGVPRGGLVPAVTLSHLLSLPLVIDEKKITNTTLLVDDISDTGGTLQKLTEEKHKNNIVVTLWAKNNSRVKPDYFVNTKENEWVVFPWETEKSSLSDDTIG